MELSGLDYGIIVGALVIMLVIGVAASRLAGRSLEHYFLGGRNLPWYMLGVSGMSSWSDVTGTMIITSFLYLMGPLGLYIEFRGGAVLVLAFMLAFANKWTRRSGCMTPAEWNTYRFGTGLSAEVIRFVTALFGVVTTIGSLAFLVRGATLFMGLIFPLDPTLLTLGLVLFASIYTVLAGFYGVVLTDMLQGAIMIAGCIVISLIAWHQVPDAAMLAATARQVTGNPNWVAAAPTWYVTVPKGYEAYHCLMMAALFYLVRSVLGGLGAASPIALAARNTREASLICVVQGITMMFRWPMMISFAIMAIFMVAKMEPGHEALAQAAQAIHAAQPGLTDNNWHEFTSRISHHPETASPGLVDKLAGFLGPGWENDLYLLGHQGTIDPELVIPAVIRIVLKPGLKGFLIAGLLSALMGALTSQVNPTSALFVRDIYQNFLRKQAKNRELIAMAYISSIAIIVTSFLIGLAASNMNELWAWYVMSLGAGALGPSVMRLFWWRTNAWGMACGLLLGMLGAIVQKALFPGLSEWWHFTLMTAMSFGATIVGSLLTEPIPKLVVKNFYETTRPFGFWKPFWDELPKQTQAAWRHEHRSDIIATLIALVWQVCLFLLPMQFLTHNWPAFFVLLPVFVGCCVGLYFFWWKNLPPPDEHVPDFVNQPPVHTLEELKAAEEA